MKTKYLSITLFFFAASISAQVNITIDTDNDNIAISPYMYGRNGAPADEEEFNLIKESGICFERMNSGNNCSKYNWRKKITSHPDWYGNVYALDWDKTAQEVQEKLPNVQGMFAFQLMGKVAKTDEYNFNEWDYNQAQWWSGCSKKVVGGGSFDENGVATLGDTSLYLQDWPADSTVAIYPHWRDDLHLDMDQFNYWNMDNEMEIWGGTHNDVYPSVYNDSIFEDIMQKYFAVAKAIRKINPNAKICGPNAASEWTWFKACGNVRPTYQGKEYCWLEYFILRCAEEEKKSGVKMIDIFDLHNYPEVTSDADMLQTHRLYYDEAFIYPKANGVKTINGGWDNNQRKEYIFVRCKEWIDQYFGTDNNIQFGVGEFNIQSSASNMVQALSYASHIGEGTRNGMNYFTPWTWYPSMWEVVHLYSTFAKQINVSAVSSEESMVSAYTSKNATNDSLTIILVNRSPNTEKTVDMDILHTVFMDGSYPTYTLSELPETVTFKSHEENALQQGTINISNNHVALKMAPYSITAITLFNGETNASENIAEDKVFVYPNPSTDVLHISSTHTIDKVEIIGMNGLVYKNEAIHAKSTSIVVSNLSEGIYFVRTITNNGTFTSKVTIQ